MHEVHVLRQGLAERSGEGFDATVGDEPTAYLGFDTATQLVDPRLVLVLEQPLLEGRELEGRARRGSAVGALAFGLGRGAGPRLGHEPRQHTVEIEVPERAVEVVRAAHRATGLHARIAADGEPGDRCQHRLIALPQRLVEHGGDLLGRHRLTPTGAVSLAAALSLPSPAAASVFERSLRGSSSEMSY